MRTIQKFSAPIIVALPETTGNTAGNVIRFGEYSLDPLRGVLSRKGHALNLQTQPMRLLTLLIEKAPEILSRE